MDTTKQEPKRITASSQIIWKSKKVWGTVGNTYYTEVLIGDLKYRFVLGQPRHGFWVAQGWMGPADVKHGTAFLYRDDTTLTAVKYKVRIRVNELLAEADKAGAR